MIYVIITMMTIVSARGTGAGVTKMTGISKVGILTSISDDTVLNSYYTNPSKVVSFIDSSHMSYASIGGSLPIVISYDTPFDSLKTLLDQTDMILLTGIPSSAGENKQYEEVVNYVTDYAIKRNNMQAQVPYPILSISSSFPLFLSAINGLGNVITWNNTYSNVSMGLDVDEQELSKTRVLSSMNTSRLLSCLKKSVYFNSNSSVTSSTFDSSNLKDSLLKVGTVMVGGVQYVGMVEHKAYPFVGLQYDPSKTIYGRSKYMPNLDRSSVCTRHASDVIISVIDVVKKYSSFGMQIDAFRWSGTVDTPYIVDKSHYEQIYMYKLYYNI